MTTRREFVAHSAAAIVAPVVLGGARVRTIVQGLTTLDPWLEIDSAALAFNASAASRTGGGKPIVAVVKNNAYGLGLAAVGPALDRHPNVIAFAVVRPDEARTLKRAGVRKPVILMGPATEEELVELVRLDVIQSPYRPDAPALLARVSRSAGRPIRVHLYVDTGMHRMGVPVAQALPWIEELQKTGAVKIEGAFTELVEDADFDVEQASRLTALRTAASSQGVDIGMLHAASTDAIQHGTTATFLDALRPGLALYGGYVSDRAMQVGGYRAAYRLKARVIRIDRLSAGEGVSYHRRWKTNTETWIATLAIGHVDGYPSGATKGCEVLVGGKLYPVIGYVSASHTVLDLGAETAVKVGDVATLVGPDHPALHPNEIARRAGYSEYNMFMHLSPTLKRVLV
jgi:alanine racemase